MTLRLNNVRAVWWISLIVLLWCPALLAQEEGPEWRAVFCPQKTYLAQAVGDKGAWERLWQTAMGEKAPALDFSQYVAAAVFLGEKPTGGYWIEFGEPRLAGSKMVIPFKVHDPQPGQFVAQMLTQPFYIKTFKKMGAKEVAVEKLP
jgi:hypothetical protein